jgi:hypothetical protein
MSKSMRPGGAGLMLIAGLLGATAALYDYVTPATGIDHTGGVILVLVSCILMLLAAYAVLVMKPGALTSILVFLIFLDILGTGTAAWFLESGLVMAAMAIATVGFFSLAYNRGVTR